MTRTTQKILKTNLRRRIPDTSADSLTPVMKLPTTPTDFLRFSKLLLEKLPPGVRTRARSPASFPKSLKIAFSVISFSLQLPPPFSLPPPSLSLRRASALYWKVARPRVADVSHYREIKKIKARTEGRNLLDDAVVYERLSLSLSLLFFFLFLARGRANTHTEAFTVSWESPGLRESFSGWINGSDE